MKILSSISFDDSSAYDKGTGIWSQLVGAEFLDWLERLSGQKWIDIGCGSGSFTEQIAKRYSTWDIVGIDPSEPQIEFARGRQGTRNVVFEQADAMSLPLDTDSFEVATMALALFFLPDPRKGIAEMVRVVKPGGTIAAYVWDAFNGGLPLEPIQAELRALNIEYPLPQSVRSLGIGGIRLLWIGAELLSVETRIIRVKRTFANFEDFWKLTASSPTIKPILFEMTMEALEKLKDKVRLSLPPGSQGRVINTAKAIAIKGLVYSASL